MAIAPTEMKQVVSAIDHNLIGRIIDLVKW